MTVTLRDFAKGERRHGEVRGWEVKKMTMKTFEKSKFDKEKPGEKEGSKADLSRDKKQLAAVNKKRGFKNGGKVKC